MDYRRENAADISRGIGETHKGTSEVGTEIHVVGVMTAINGDVAGDRNGEDADGESLLVAADEAETDEGQGWEDLTEGIADHARRARRHLVGTDRPV